MSPKIGAGFLWSSSRFFGGLLSGLAECFDSFFLLVECCDSTAFGRGKN